MTTRFDRTRAAQLVRAARLDRGMSQAELSRAAGMSQPNVAAIETGTRTPSDDALMRLLQAADYRPSLAVEANAQEIVDAGARHGLRDIRVFGSVATGADHFASDIDLLARVESGRGYFDIAAFTHTVEQLTGFPVDVIVDDERRPAFLASTTMATL
ncbi:XRE family transcriptional regulator [Microbacterium sp. lyk4-40-TSB-66]|uniref:helix-turn-helix domain-containing protein n=1 Tax=Microbacterium sp. lyk4-40-TSB-66 TaxID=3040294 RepID=UPI00254A22C6|nr:XRE family transcriptional regulator [Microbacterium sp. lyk4-40-TSB-66]